MSAPLPSAAFRRAILILLVAELMRAEEEKFTSPRSVGSTAFPLYRGLPVELPSAHDERMLLAAAIFRLAQHRALLPAWPLQWQRACHAPLPGTDDRCYGR